MLRNRVAEMPGSHEVAPAAVARVHQRGALKFGAFATAVILVVAGAAAAVAEAARNGTDRVSTAEPTTVPVTTTGPTTTTPVVPPGRVATAVCPVAYAVT